MKKSIAFDPNTISKESLDEMLRKFYAYKIERDTLPKLTFLCVIKHLFVRFLTNITFIQSREDNI